MPAGIARAKFIPILARSLKLRPQSLRDRLNKKGHNAPYDETTSLKIVEELGFKTDKYRERIAKMKGAAPAASAPVKAKATNGQHGPNGKDKSASRMRGAPRGRKVPAEIIEKRRATWNQRLIPRLAALFPGGKTTSNKQKVRRILANHGWTKKPYTDEERALTIFKEEGIDISKFEYKGGKAPAPESAPSPTPTVTRIEDHPEYWMINAAKHARINLEQMEAAMWEMRDLRQINRIGKPWDMAFNALNVLRYPPAPKSTK